MRWFWRYGLIIVLFSTIQLASVAQDDSEDVCPPFINEAITLASESCDDLGRNSACYGNNQVVASFTDEALAEDFAEPADTADLADVVNIGTSALNADESIWGLALMNVQANIPDTIPGQAVLFFLMGETTVQNQVTGDAPTITPTDIIISASQRVNVRSGAGRNFNPLGAADPNSTWTATGVSEDFSWVRITFAETDGWISRDLITPVDETAFNALPVVTESILSPMQAFYFTTGTGNPTCKQAPDALVIQSPERLSVNLSVNGATVRIGSTIILTTQLGETDENDDLPADCRRTEAIVFDGELLTNQNTVRIPLGHSATFTACLDEEGNITPQDDWQDNGRVSPERLAEFAILETLPDGLLHYPIRIPTPEEIEEAENINTAPPPSNQDDNDNDDDDDDNDNDDEETSGINCNAFVAISPLDAVTWGVQEFRWSALQGVEFFYLTVERNDGVAGSVFIS
ncbi:MAG: hypothetical protein KJ043_03790, partial [Anaerolineae bacterium]|nr:hypothetical protein [Anaerolineae bacterium]